jgi:hypothetical protein
MSASGYKQTFQAVSQNVRFTPESGRKWVTEFMSAFDPQRKWNRLRPLREFGLGTLGTSPSSLPRFRPMRACATVLCSCQGLPGKIQAK